jgi:hypothetical protein
MNKKLFLLNVMLIILDEKGSKKMWIKNEKEESFKEWKICVMKIFVS